MSTERLMPIPQKQAKGAPEFPASFMEAIQRERPEVLNWDNIDAAVAVLKGEKEAVVPKPPEPEPTESQKFFRDMYRTGKLSPYQKDRPKIDLKAAAEAWNNPQVQGVDSKIMAVDLALRGGADKEYNKLGGLGKRATRMAVMAGNMVPFFVFDVATSIPSELVFQYAERYVGGSQLAKGVFSGVKKTIEVQNDKVVTALGDILATKLTGEKGGWIHEAGDKSADLIQTAADDYAEDAINGPVIESFMRSLFQIPVAGALIEQGWTRLSLLQEKSQLNKGIAKSFYMGIGLAIGVYRDVKNQDLHPKKSPSAWIADKIWSKTRLVLDRNPYNFYEFIDTGKIPKWMKDQVAQSGS